MTLPKPNRWAKAAFQITNQSANPFTITVSGRDKFTLSELCKAGPTGITSASYPGARIAAYVCSLRKQGVLIETQPERHSGPFSGRHARYILQSKVSMPSIRGAA